MSVSTFYQYIKDIKAEWKQARVEGYEEHIEKQLANLRLVCGAKGILKSLQEMIEMYEKVQPAGGYQGVYEIAKSRVNNILKK